LEQINFEKVYPLAAGVCLQTSAASRLQAEFARRKQLSQA
jgi:hypothetical protein